MKIQEIGDTILIAIATIPRMLKTEIGDTISNSRHSVRLTLPSSPFSAHSTNSALACSSNRPGTLP